MKALFAYTATAYANAGLTLPNGVTGVWQPVGGSPFIHYQTAVNSFQLNGKELLYFNTYCYISARLFDVLTTLTADEVVTFGYKVRANGVWGARYATDHTALYDAAGNVDNVITLLDIIDNSSSSLVSYVEVVIDPNARLLTGYINGKKIRSVPIPASRNLTDTFAGMGRATSNPNSCLYNDFYAAIYKKSEGPVIMGAWSCEDLEEVSSELRDNNGVMNRNTVNEAFKTVAYKLPAPGAAVAIDVKAANPNVMSKLIAVSSDGKTSDTKELTTIGTKYSGTGDWPTVSKSTNAGRSVTSINPAPDATALTVKLKAQFLQE